MIESDSGEWSGLSSVEWSALLASLYLSKAACLKGFSRLKRAVTLHSRAELRGNCDRFGDNPCADSANLPCVSGHKN